MKMTEVTYWLGYLWIYIGYIGFLLCLDSVFGFIVFTFHFTPNILIHIHHACLYDMTSSLNLTSALVTLSISLFIFHLILFGPWSIIFISLTIVHLSHIYNIYVYSYHIGIQPYCHFIFLPIWSPQISILGVSLDRVWFYLHIPLRKQGNIMLR